MAQATIRPSDVVRTITAKPLRIVLPVVLLTTVAAVYSLVRPATWEASQALVVRDEAGDRLTRPGKFVVADEMKTSQETILELAKSRAVLWKALAEVGPALDATDVSQWPTEQALEALQANVKISPPKGAEFGKTEVFYLKVQDTSQPRAVALASAICRQLQARFGELREAKARGATEELGKTVELAKEDLAVATRALGAMEHEVGADLADLRILNESPSGDSDLRRTATEVEKELRTYRAIEAENEEFSKLLVAAQDDPAKLLASPSMLLKSQPALGRLKDGLVDAQLRTGQALGTMSEAHPLARGARAAEDAIRQQLHDEIVVALQGVQMDQRINAQRIASLEKQDRELQVRLARLANQRAEYANLVVASKHRGETLKTVEHDLAEARSSQAAARTSSLISLIDSPDAGARPLGPGKAIITLAGFAGGLLVALAFAFLSVAPSDAPVAAAEVAVPVQAAPQSIRQSLPRSSISKNRPLEGLTVRQALERVASRRI